MPAALPAGRPRFPAREVESRLGPCVTGAEVFVGELHLEDLEVGGPRMGAIEPEPHSAHPGCDAGGVHGHETECFAVDLGDGVGLEPAAVNYQRTEHAEQLCSSGGISISHDEFGMIEVGKPIV